MVMKWLVVWQFEECFHSMYLSSKYINTQALNYRTPSYKFFILSLQGKKKNGIKKLNSNYLTKPFFKMKAKTKYNVSISLSGISLPPELSLEFTCGRETSVACMLVTDAAVTAGAGLFLLKMGNKN